MPLIFGLLVILNAVFLAWQFYEKQNAGQEYAATKEPIPGKKLELLGERHDQKASSEQGEVAAGKVAGSDSNEMSCYRIGPILDNTSLERLRGALTSSGFEVKVESFAQTGSGVYIVYIPPQASHEKAVALANELQARGMTASAVNDPQYANSVFVASFASRDQALDMNDKLAQMGYQGEVREASANRQEQWLKVESAGSAAKSQIDRIISGTPHLKREPAPCES